jgi:hypothetical protein
MKIPQVTIKDVFGFARQWEHNGIGTLVDDTHAMFTRDFTNLVVTQVIRSMAAAQAADADAKKLVVVTG